MHTPSPLDRRAAVAALAALAAPLALGMFARRALARGAQEATPGTRDATDLYPVFRSEPALTGTVRCVGSSAVGLVLNALRDDFRVAQPGVTLETSSAGSASAPKALASGEADLAPMSREMRASEIAEVEKARGAEVRFVDIALDAIAICVHRDNPLTKISLRDLDRIFGRERRRGGPPANSWGDLGVEASPWSTRKIVLFGTGAQTGSQGVLQEVVLQGGELKSDISVEPVSSSVVQGVAASPGAIGYCSAFYNAARVRQLELETLAGGEFVALSDESIRSGRYPLARALRIYFVADPRKRAPAAMQLLRFLLAEDGQSLMDELGQRKLSPAQARAQFAKTNY